MIYFKLIIELTKNQTFDLIRLRENIQLGQRIEGYAIDIDQNGNWTEIAKGESIRANRLIKLNTPIKTNKLRLRITQSPVCIALSDFGLFLEK